MRTTARVHHGGAVVDVVVAEGRAVTGDGRDLGPLDGLRLAPPCAPTKIVGVGKNYHSTLDGRGEAPPSEPWVFLKAPNAVVASGEPVLLPAGQQVKFEGEIGLVIGRRASRLTEADWRDHVRGITAANDLTALDWRTSGEQWWRSKSSDTFCPLGPTLLEGADLDAPIRIRAWVDGVLLQDDTSDDMIFGFGELLSFITRTVTLEPGDVVLTGSPAGAAPLVVGSAVEVEVAGVGRLRNPVEAAP